MADANSTSNAVIDDLTEKLGKLSAMLLAVTGNGFEPFRTMNNEMQGNYLWACSDMACDAQLLTQQLARQP